MHRSARSTVRPSAPSTTRVGADSLAKIDGEPLPNAPEYTLDLTARWDQPLNDFARVFSAADRNMQGYTRFTLYRAREFTANGDFEGGLKIGHAPPSDAWELSMFARNISNEKKLKGEIENCMAAVFDDARIVGVSLSGKFR